MSLPLCFNYAVSISLSTGIPSISVGPIWLDRVSCIGTESKLVSCSHSSVGRNTCTHSQDVGILCSNAGNCQEGDVRFQGGNATTSGYVEICHKNVWGAVCNHMWSASDAQVVCTQLGLSMLSTFENVCILRSYLLCN